MTQHSKLIVMGALCVGLVSLSGCYRPPPPDLGLRPLLTQQKTPDRADVATSGPLSCEESVRMGVSKHPTLRAARAGLRVSVAEVERIGVPGSFEIRVRESLSNLGEDSRVGLRWNLPKPGEMDASRYAAEAQVQLSRAEVRLMEVELGAQIRQAHLAVRRAQAESRYAAGQAKLATSRLKMARTRFEAGTTTRVAVSTAELNDKAALADQKMADAQVTEAIRVFALWTAGASTSEQCTLQITEFDLEGHPVIEMARARARREHGEGAASNRGGWFWPRFLQVSWYQEQDKADRTLVQVGIPVPLPGSSRAAVSQARYERRVEQLAAVRFEVQQAIEQASARLSGQEEVLRLLASEKKSYQTAQELVRKGSEERVGSAEIYQLKMVLLEHERRRALAELEVESARIDLQRAQGSP